MSALEMSASHIIVIERAQRAACDNFANQHSRHWSNINKTDQIYENSETMRFKLVNVKRDDVFKRNKVGEACYYAKKSYIYKHLKISSYTSTHIKNISSHMGWNSLA